MKVSTSSCMMATLLVTNLVIMNLAMGGDPHLERTGSVQHRPAKLTQNMEARPINQRMDTMPVSQSGYEMPPGQGTVMGSGNYAQTHAPLYPCPVPNVPTNVGGTYITSQYLSPHEMLYPHTYRSMYGPFYWKVHGKWVLTPFGVRSHDCWQLQGTEVTVKYRSHYKPFSGFHPPVIH